MPVAPSAIAISNEMVYTPEEAQQAVQSGAVDAIAFGTAYIANPDLVEHFLQSRRAGLQRLSHAIKQNPAIRRGWWLSLTLLGLVWR